MIFARPREGAASAGRPTFVWLLVGYGGSVVGKVVCWLKKKACPSSTWDSRCGCVHLSCWPALGLVDVPPVLEGVALLALSSHQAFDQRGVGNGWVPRLQNYEDKQAQGSKDHSPGGARCASVGLRRVTQRQQISSRPADRNKTGRKKKDE